ncbi:MFS transporter [Amycolatopsis nivea]|uniref:MFS transporter n=1 Tax=Amycolatopsis nivea TaxID=1644109 RepID=UPI00106F69B3|nr:MFS transporter [Amycolatopsis nivea]
MDADASTERAQYSNENGPAARGGRERWRMIMTASVGNFAEWYDWGIYGVVATLIAQQFFPAGNSALALVGAYAIFAIAYLTRPFGTVVFGHIADSLGRPKALTFTIVLTCTSTAMIGFIPTYASIGAAAPLLLVLCRLIQSLGTGGEHATAIAFVYEHGASGKKAKAVGMLSALTLAGLLSGTLLATGLSAILPDGAWTSWGWRVLFWLSLPMGLIGLYVRRNARDGEEFRQVKNHQRRKAALRSSPVLEAIRTSWRKILVFVAFLGTWSIVSAIVTSYLATFLKQNHALTQAQAYGANTTASASAVVFVLLFAPVVDRVGLSRATVIASIFVAAAIVPGFLLAGTNLAGAYLGAVLLGMAKGVLAVPSLLAVSQIFPARFRVSAGGLSYNLAASALGGTAPLVAVALNEIFGSSLGFSCYIVAAALVTLVIALTVGRRWMTESAEHPGSLAR